MRLAAISTRFEFRGALDDLMAVNLLAIRSWPKGLVGRDRGNDFTGIRIIHVGRHFRGSRSGTLRTRYRQLRFGRRSDLGRRRCLLGLQSCDASADAIDLLAERIDATVDLLHRTGQ